MALIIKGRLLDEKNPTICVPITENNHDDIISKALLLSNKGVPMVEWRGDCFEDLFDGEKLKEILGALKNILANRIFLVTLRSADEGGNLNADEFEIRKLLLDIARTRCADMIDLEYFRFQDPDSLIKEIQSMGAAVVASHHNFKETPTRKVCLRLLETMQEGDADVIKLAVMPSELSDVMRLGLAANTFKENLPEALMIIIAMGEKGMVTRICPTDFSSCVTFGSVGAKSAPGQVEYDELFEIIEDVKRLR